MNVMSLINIRHPEESVTFGQAVVRGLGSRQGLYFPRDLRPLADVDALLEQDFISRSAAILGHLTEHALPPEMMREFVTQAFDFPIKLTPLADGTRALELFHGPSLAFKDFGARFMARCLEEFRGGEPVTILTATSGDTGAAVAHAFYNLPGIQVVVLYPQGMLSPLQEKLFCTLSGNITTVAVGDNFDVCQRLVKEAFDDDQVRLDLRLNSANSINIARLLAQVCYYFEGAASVPNVDELVFSVPSGNFGNITAGLLARAIGLPYKRIVAATNANDTVPRYLASGNWNPKPTVATLTNAMDISLPNNFPRVLELDARHGLDLGQLLTSVSLNDAATRMAMGDLYALGYLSDPHSALAWSALRQSLTGQETGMFLCTAHPAKFSETIEDTLGIAVPLPPALAAVKNSEVLSKHIPGNFAALRELLFSL